jgi:hypothetical protein
MTNTQLNCVWMDDIQHGSSEHYRKLIGDNANPSLLSNNKAQVVIRKIVMSDLEDELDHNKYEFDNGLIDTDQYLEIKSMLNDNKETWKNALNQFEENEDLWLIVGEKTI